MKRYRPIDVKRDDAITLAIEDEEDASPVKELLSTSAGLYAIKEMGVFKVCTADDIDPKRTNPNISNLSQRVLSAGYWPAPRILIQLV